MSLPRYERYKESGVEWLGEVPEGWEVAPLKRYFKIVGGSTPKSEQEIYWDGEIIWVTPSDLSKLQTLYINDSQRKITDDGLASCGTSLVPANSIILSTRAPIGSLAIANTTMCTNQGCKSLVPDSSVDAKFYGYLLSNSSTELNIRGKGTTFLELSGDELGAFKVAFPPLPEQQTIAVFLDRETGKIDALVTEQERLIALLKEKRQATISHAVTKGLNPAAPLKDSGIEWLGEVPEGWEVTSIKRIASIRYGIGEPPKYQEEGIPLIRATNVNAGLVTQEGMVYVNPADIPEKRIIWLSAGDIIVVRSGAYTGDSAIIKSEHCPCIAGFDMVVNPYGCLPYFLQYALLSTYLKNDQLDLEKTRAAQPHLNAEELGSCFILLPTSEEQSAIVAFLDSETAKNDTLTGEARQAISLLKERRSALISAVVTGKIDVRGVGVVGAPLASPSLLKAGAASSAPTKASDHKSIANKSNWL